MATKEEQEFRDFIHTVDVLTASALAEHEQAKASRPTMPTRLARHPYLAFAAAASLVLAIGLPVYLTMPSMQSRGKDAERQIAMSPLATDAARQHAAVEAEKRQGERQATGNELEESRRRMALAEAETKRVEEMRTLALEDGRKAQETRRIAALEEARRKADADAEEKRRDEHRVAALEANRNDEKRRKEEDERLRLASIPSDEQRAAFVQRVQQVLKKNRCYDGAIDGGSTATQEGLDEFVRNASKKGKTKPARIELAKASVGDFESWLKDADDISGLCVPAAVAKPKRPEPMARVRTRDDPGRYAPSYDGGKGYSGGGGGAGAVQGIR